MLALLAAAPLSAGEVRGRLLVAEKAAAGLTVTALPYESPFDAARREESERVTLTTRPAADGSFRFAAAARGSILSVRKSSFAALDVPNVKPGVLARPLVLAPGLSLAGVVKAPGGKPAAGTLV